MEFGYWILDEAKKPIKVHDVKAWARWFERNDARNVGDDDINGVRVSTKFLGLDHQFGDGPPILFETMIFNGQHDQWQGRCSTWEQAENMHKNACEMVHGETVNE